MTNRNNYEKDDNYSRFVEGQKSLDENTFAHFHIASITSPNTSFSLL